MTWSPLCRLVLTAQTPVLVTVDKITDTAVRSLRLNLRSVVELPVPRVHTTPPTTTTTSRKPPRPYSPPGPCRADQATCQSGECIPRDYICDGERDCSDGSDEYRCGKIASRWQTHMCEHNPPPHPTGDTAATPLSCCPRLSGQCLQQ